MPIATLKRLLPRICIPAAVAAAGVVFLAYPRRQVPSMLRLVPREGLAVCVRARGLGQIWRRCARSEFGRMVARGEIFPLDELRAADEEFREEWEDLDTSQWPEIAGRELVDKGAVTSPEFAWWHPQKGWGIENHGVDPDIVVENLPQELGRGIDAQLDRGISEVLRLHREKPPQKPGFGPVRDRSRQAFEVEITGR